MRVIQILTFYDSLTANHSPADDTYHQTERWENLFFKNWNYWHYDVMHDFYMFVTCLSLPAW